eukprot:gene10595-56436_t
MSAVLLADLRLSRGAAKGESEQRRAVGASLVDGGDGDALPPPFRAALSRI